MGPDFNYVIDKLDDGIEINFIKFRFNARASSIIGNKIRSQSDLGKLMIQKRRMDFNKEKHYVPFRASNIKKEVHQRERVVENQ